MADNFRKIEEQEEVLAIKDRNIVVSASAGSGKTSVMTRKITNLIIEDKIKIEKLLVLTYTKSAAAEMKQRLSESLLKCAAGNESLLTEMDNILSADISTFHAFYQKMIKKYFYVLGINPSFSILTEEESLRLKNLAMDEAIKTFKNNKSQEYISLVDKLGRKRNDKNIRHFIFELHEFFFSQSNKENWRKNEALICYDENKKTNIALEILKNNLLEGVLYYKEMLSELQRECELLSETKLIEQINGILSELDKVRGDTYLEVYTAISTVEFPRLDGKGTNEELYEKLKELKKCLGQALEQKNYGTCDDIISSFGEIKNNITMLLEIEQQYEKQLKSMKNKQNKLEFSDLEEMMLSLLSHDKIKEEIKNSYEYIFVDEFQDANRIQEQIISLIAKENNVFMVGDPKQSIYGFRQSDTEIIIKKIEDFREDQKSEAKFLNSNFRSDKRVLEFVNTVFSSLMTKELTGVDYKKEALLKGEGEYERSEICPVTITVIKENENSADEFKHEIYSVRKNAEIQKLKNNLKTTEAKLIADKISKILSKKIYDVKLKSLRSIEFSDIAILVRTRNDFVDELMKEFTKFQIPFSYISKTDISKYDEIALLLNFLKLAENDYQDIALISVLTSPIVKITNEDLLEIRKSDATNRYFYEAMWRYASSCASTDISNKISAFKTELEKFRFEIKNKGIYFALLGVVRRHNLINYFFSAKDGYGKKDRLNSFINYFSGSIYNFNLSGFLRQLEGNNGEFIISEQESAAFSSVTISTIHASKGLEYPVLFLADMGSDLNKSGGKKCELKISRNLGIALKYYSSENRKIFNSTAESAIDIVNKRNDFAEKIRLLYVGLTRAKNALFISGVCQDAPVKKLVKAKDVLYLKPRTYLNLILSSFSQCEIDAINANSSFESENLEIDVFKNGEIVFENQAYSAKESSDISDSFKEKLVKKLKYVYPFERETLLAEKTSVTEATQPNSDYESHNTTPLTFGTSEHLGDNTALEIGNHYHKILEEINIYATEKEIMEFVSSYFVNNNIHELENWNVNSTAKIVSGVLNLIRSVIPNGNEIIREKEFLMKSSVKEIMGSGSDAEILIQGKIDLLSIGKKNVIIDYKYTENLNKEKLVLRYGGQLRAYKNAIEKALQTKEVEVWLLLIQTTELIKVLPVQ